MTSKLPVPFTPVPVRPRHDGWTVERQVAFIEKLADTGSITAACKHVGMSRESVRKLRRRPCSRMSKLGTIASKHRELRLAQRLRRNGAGTESLVQRGNQRCGRVLVDVPQHADDALGSRGEKRAREARHPLDPRDVAPHG